MVDKVLVYTVIVGEYDSLKKPLWCPPHVDYRAYVTHAPLESFGWQIHSISDNVGNPKMANRRLKILRENIVGDYRCVVYVDGNVQVIGSLGRLVGNFLESGCALGLFEHNERFNPWEELDESKAQGRMTESEYQFERGLLEEFENVSSELDLFDASVLLRNTRHDNLSSIEGRWWRLFNRGRTRDQLWLPIVASENSHSIISYRHWRQSLRPTFFRFPHGVNPSSERLPFRIWGLEPRVLDFTLKLIRKLRRRQR